MELPCFQWFSEFMTGFIYGTGVDIFSRMHMLLELTFCFFQDSSNFYLLVEYLFVSNFWSITYFLCFSRGRCGRVVVGFTPIAFTTYVVRLIPVNGCGIIHTTLCFKECRWLVADWWFSCSYNAWWEIHSNFVFL